MANGFVLRLKGKGLFSKDSQHHAGGGGATMKASGIVYANTSSAGLGNTSDTSEDVLDTYALPGNSLYANNYTINVYAFGSFAANTHTKTLKLYFGSETISITDSTSQTGGSPWILQMTVMKQAASVQVLSGQTLVRSTVGAASFQTGAETDTSAITLKVTGQTGTAAANDVLLNGWYVEVSNV